MNELEILLVEDNRDHAELALHSFNRHRLANKVHVVYDGEEALDFMFAEGAYADRAAMSLPKLVLLDLKLPKLDGVDVLRRIRGDPRTRLVPVTVLTTSEEERDLVETYELGVNSYIVKPVDFKQFTDAIATVGMYWLILNRPPPPTPMDRGGQPE